MKCAVCVITHPDLQARINAHVLEKGSLCDGSEADYCVSSHLPHITKVNVCGQVCAARSLQHLMQFVSSKTLQTEKKVLGHVYKEYLLQIGNGYVATQ